MVITEFIVVRKGVEMFKSKSKKEADAYDKMLDTAEQIDAFINTFGLDIPEKTREELSVKLSQHRDVLSQLFKGVTLDAVKTTTVDESAEDAK